MGFGMAAVQLAAAPIGLAVGLGGTVAVAVATVTGVGRRRKPKLPTSIVITGATYGIGESLAIAYARDGVTLVLTGRNKKLLEAVGEACRKKGARTRLGALDVTDRAGMEKFLLQADAAQPIDLVIANAGVTESSAGLSHDLVASTRKLFSVNVDGVFNTILPLIPKMRERGSGQIAIMSSLAGTVGLPGLPAYSGTKCAMRAYGEALRGALYHEGVHVNVICPGYITSPMTESMKRIGISMPLKWEMEPAVRLMVQALARDEPVLQFPGALHAFLTATGWGVPTFIKHELQRLGVPPYHLPMLMYKRPEIAVAKVKETGKLAAAAAAATPPQLAVPQRGAPKAVLAEKVQGGAQPQSQPQQQGEEEEEEAIIGPRVSEAGLMTVPHGMGGSVLHNYHHTYSGHYPRRHHRHHDHHH